MFDHNLCQDNLVGVDFCERMVRETNPSVLARAETTLAPHSDVHGHRTIAEIMRALNPFEGSLYKEALLMSRLAREMFCLMEGRHVHPRTLHPGGGGTVPSVQLFSEYLVRLTRYVDFVKRMVPLHDDLFDFFLEAVPGYERVGQRRVLLGCWGAFQDPDACDFRYQTMSQWGREMFVTPGIVIDGELITTDLVEINLGIRILLGSSFYDDWEGQETFVRTDPLGNPIDRRHPWNQTTLPRPQKRDLQGRYTWVMSPRWLDRRTGEHLACHSGDTQTWSDFKVPDEAIGCGFHEAVRGLLSHHMVIRNGRIANYHPYPPTPWNASPRDSFGTPGPYEDAIQGSPLFEENGPESFKGIDIMRTVRSFDPCLPCGVHMMLGGGKVLELRHSPAFGA